SAATMLSSITIELDSPTVSPPFGRVMVTPPSASVTISSLRGTRIDGAASSCCPWRLTAAWPFTSVIEATGPSALAGGGQRQGLGLQQAGKVPTSLLPRCTVTSRPPAQGTIACNVVCFLHAHRPPAY